MPNMGKTIEACIVIRQFFIDRPYDASALVLVPPSLVTQWTEELGTRFSLEAELGSGLHVISSKSLDEIAAPRAVAARHASEVLVIEGAIQFVVLPLGLIERNPRPGRRAIEQAREVDAGVRAGAG